jgi:hypothetical protein
MRYVRGNHASFSCFSIIPSTVHFTLSEFHILKDLECSPRMRSHSTGPQQDSTTDSNDDSILGTWFVLTADNALMVPVQPPNPPAPPLSAQYPLVVKLEKWSILRMRLSDCSAKTARDHGVHCIVLQKRREGPSRSSTNSWPRFTKRGKLVPATAVSSSFWL